jgi:hypothetical protein
MTGRRLPRLSVIAPAVLFAGIGAIFTVMVRRFAAIADLG